MEQKMTLRQRNIYRDIVRIILDLTHAPMADGGVSAVEIEEGEAIQGIHELLKEEYYA